MINKTAAALKTSLIKFVASICGVQVMFFIFMITNASKEVYPRLDKLSGPFFVYIGALLIGAGIKETFFKRGEK